MKLKTRKRSTVHNLELRASRKVPIKITCPDTINCFAIGMETDVIKQYFNGFDNFKLIVGPVIKMGAQSENGFIQKIHYKKNNYRPHENTIDQHFLKDMVYQTAIKDCYLNDEYFNYEGFGEKIKRDRKMDDFAFIGEPFDKNNNQLTNYRDSIKNRYYNY